MKIWILSVIVVVAHNPDPNVVPPIPSNRWIVSQVSEEKLKRLDIRSVFQTKEGCEQSKLETLLKLRSPGHYTACVEFDLPGERQ